MSYDNTVFTSSNCPKRWREIAKYLVETDTDQLAILDSEVKGTFEYIYSKDFDEDSVPYLIVTFASKDANGITLSIIDRSGDVTSYDGDYEIKEYDGTAPTAPTASTALTVTSEEGTISYEAGDKPVDGKHVIVAVDATDAAGESQTFTVEAIYAPSAIADVAGAAGSEQVTVTFTDAVGAASQTLYYMLCPLGTETAAAIVAGGTAVADPDGTGGEVIADLTPSSQYGFVVAATNPGGTTNSNVDYVTPTA